MSEQFRKAPSDHNTVVYTAIELQTLLDHEEAVSVLDYFVQHHEIDDVPILIVELYLRSLIALSEYNAAFRLLDRFVSAKGYANARANEEAQLSAMQINVILSVEYIELFNNIVNVYSTQFIEKLMQEEPQNVLAFATSFNKIEQLFLQEPNFCSKNYQQQKMFAQVVDRITFVHNFLAAKCISVMHRHYRSKDEKVSEYLTLIRLLLAISEFGDTRTKNLESETCLNSINLHVKGALLCIDLIKSLQNMVSNVLGFENIFYESNFETDGGTSQVNALEERIIEVKEYLQQFLQYANNWQKRTDGNQEFAACVLYKDLGYEEAAQETLDTFNNQVAILDSLNITQIQDFVATLNEHADNFRFNAQKSLNFAELETNMLENVKLLIALGDIAAEQHFGFCSLVLYSVAFKIENLLANAAKKRQQGFYMEGQYDSVLSYYKNQVLAPFSKLILMPDFCENQKFQYLYEKRFIQLEEQFLETFCPEDYAFDYTGEPAFDLEQMLAFTANHCQNNLDLHNICAYRISYIYAQLAASLLESGHFNSAVEYSKSAIKVWPTRLAYFVLVRVYNQLSDFNMARSTAIECGRYHPESREAKIMSGEVLGVRTL